MYPKSCARWNCATFFFGQFQISIEMFIKGMEHPLFDLYKQARKNSLLYFSVSFEIRCPWDVPTARIRYWHGQAMLENMRTQARQASAVIVGQFHKQTGADNLIATVDMLMWHLLRHMDVQTGTVAYYQVLLFGKRRIFIVPLHAPWDSEQDSPSGCQNLLPPRLQVFRSYSEKAKLHNEQPW